MSWQTAPRVGAEFAGHYASRGGPGCGQRQRLLARTADCMMNALPVLGDVFCTHKREIVHTDGKLRKGTLIGVANGTVALDYGREGLKIFSKLGGSSCQ